MSEKTVKVWVCDECGREMLKRGDDGKEKKKPGRCENRKCRSKKWDRGGVARRKGIAGKQAEPSIVETNTQSTAEGEEKAATRVDRVLTRPVHAERCVCYVCKLRRGEVK